MQADIYNTENKKVSTMDLPEGIFNVTWNSALVHQVVTSWMSNQRKPYAHAKDRSEVSGGGKKPWRQKGTGRARHGSSRSPIWTGGGATFGPRNERNYTKKINKKMKQKALFTILSKKLAEKEVKIIDSFELKDHKTKQVAEMLAPMRDNKSSVMISKKGVRNAVLAGRNIPKNDVTYPDSLNINDCLAHKYVFFEKKAVEEFIKHYGII